MNLEGNFISSLENGTLSVLRNSLKQLSIGNHNSLNDIFDEISQLKELEVGIKSYENLNALENFKGTFKRNMKRIYIARPFFNLKMRPKKSSDNRCAYKPKSIYQVLDMGRADGITNITDGTFGELNKLEKLLLPECSLTVIHKNTFQGLTKLTEVNAVLI